MAIAYWISPTWNTTSSNVKYRVVTDLISQDVNTNSSYVRVRLEAWRTNTGYETYGNGTGCVSIGGTQSCDTITTSQKITYNSYTILSDEYTTVYHDANGAKNLTCGGYFNITSVVNGGWNYYSMDLPTIPRASTITATSANIEEATTIVINRYSSSFTHTINYVFGSLSGTVVSNTSETTIGWTIPSSFYAEIPNAASGTCQLTCLTYNAGVQIGSSTTTFTASVDSTTNAPTVSATIVDSDPLTVSLTGDNSKFVKYVSDAQFSITATAKNSATIASRSIVCDGKSSTLATGTLTDVESATFVVSTTDSRGFTASVTYNKTLVEYIKLTATAEFSRNTPVDGKVNLTYNGNYFNSTFGAQANTLTTKYRYRETGGAWSSYTNLTPVTSGNTYSQTVQLTGTFDYTKSFEFEFVAIDKVYTAGISVTDVVPAGVPVYNWNKTSFATNVPTTINGTLTATGNTSIGGTLSTTGNISTSGTISATGDLSVGGIITGTSPNLIAETTLSSSAANITVSGLDINAHGGVYEVIGSMVLASPADVAMLVNGTLGTNYRHDIWNQNGTWKQAVYSGETWGVYCGNGDTYGISWFKMLIYRAGDYRIFIDMTAQYGAAGSTINRWINGTFISTYQTNITSLKFYTLQGANLAAQSNVKVFRR